MAHWKYLGIHGDRFQELRKDVRITCILGGHNPRLHGPELC